MTRHLRTSLIEAGIMHNGCSYLLLPQRCWSQDNWEKRCGPLQWPRSKQVHQYLSLSPTIFYSSGELEAKLKTYIQKSGKGGGGDTSKANRGQSRGHLRASFEYSRYHISILS